MILFQIEHSQVLDIFSDVKRPPKYSDIFRKNVHIIGFSGTLSIKSELFSMKDL
jgi:hypothetical protein